MSTANRGNRSVNPPTEEMRLSKHLANSSIASRREADHLIEQGLVLVDGRPAELGQKVTPGSKIELTKQNSQMNKKKK
jgi:23S rRNA pseudouridine2604 synthase